MTELLNKKIKEISSTSKIKTFGIIIYTDENPNIKKMLRDNDYWKALDKVSSKDFIIFSVKPKKGSMEYPNYPKGTLGMMVPVWKEPNDNEELLELFQIKSTKELPLFFIFTKYENYFLIKHTKINDDSIDTSFKQLKELFQDLNSLTKTIHIDNNEHPVQVHDKISHILSKHNTWKLISSVDIFFTKAKKYFGLIV